MPDITMCKGEECPLKEQCLRYRATPSYFRQSYFLSPPYDEGKCSEFVEFIDKKARVKVEKEADQEEESLMG
jgi:hypothetical protein